jgi:hypothetical protein
VAERTFTVAIAGDRRRRHDRARSSRSALPVGELRLLASERSRRTAFRGEDLTVDRWATTPSPASTWPFAAAGGAASREYAPKAVAAGADRDRQVERLPLRTLPCPRGA